MKRPRGLCLLALTPLLALACGRAGDDGPIPDQELLLQIRTGAQDVALGQAFPLTVTRVWSKDLAPEPWDDAVLAPLVVRLEQAEQREDARHVQETRRYQAYAFSLEDVVVPGPVLRAIPRGGGPPREVKAEDLRLHVLLALDPNAPGAPELPGGLLEVPQSSRTAWWTALGLVAALFLAWWLLRRRRAAPQPAPVPVVAAIPPRERALARLQGLREREPRSAPEVDAYHVEASALVRDYLEEQLALRAPEMTTEEFLSAPGTAQRLAPAQRARLAGFLARCDQVKFARQPSSSAERAELLDAAGAVLRETGAA